MAPFKKSYALVLPRGYMGIYWRRSHQRKTMSFPVSWGKKSFLSAPRIRVELIRRTGRHIFVRTVQICLVAAGFHSRHPGRCPILTPDHHHHRGILAHKHHNWNHRYWSYVLFAYESIVNSNEHVWVFRLVAERLVPLGQLGKSALTRKKAGQPWTNLMSNHKTFKAVTRGFFKCQGPCIDIDMNFHQLVDKKGLLSRVIQYNWRGMYVHIYLYHICSGKSTACVMSQIKLSLLICGVFQSLLLRFGSVD